MSLTEKEFALLKQRERLLEDVSIFGAEAASEPQCPVTKFDRDQYELRLQQRATATNQLRSVEDELRTMGIETGDTK